TEPVEFMDVKAALARLGVPIPKIDDHSMLISALDERVVGHDDAKALLAAAGIMHYIRVRKALDEQRSAAVKSHVLLIGPMGRGKTLLARSLAQRLGVPFAAVDALALAEASNGSEKRHPLRKLVQAASGNAQRAQYGIVSVENLDQLVNPAGQARRQK